MITDPQLMPDFRDGLEQALYRHASAAAAPAPARRLPRVLPRPTIAGRLALGAAVLVAAIAVVFTALPGKKASHAALAEPAILTASATQPVPEGIEAGVLVRAILGPNVEFKRSITLDLRGQRIYLLDADVGWCALPQVAAAGAQGLLVCATTSQLQHTGTGFFTGGTYVALVPPGAAPPVLERTDGSRTPLEVSSNGVATASGVLPGDQIERHGVDGSTATDIAR